MKIASCHPADQGEEFRYCTCCQTEGGILTVGHGLDEPGDLVTLMIGDRQFDGEVSRKVHTPMMDLGLIRVRDPLPLDILPLSDEPAMPGDTLEWWRLDAQWREICSIVVVNLPGDAGGEHPYGSVVSCHLASHGDSGSPLLRHGRLVGIVARARAASGRDDLEFAPIDMIMRFLGGGI